MALAGGTSRVRTGPLTLHTQTAIHITELMTNRKVLLYTHRAGGGGDPRGTSRVRTGPLTLHTQTAIHITELMTNRKVLLYPQGRGGGGGGGDPRGTSRVRTGPLTLHTQTAIHITELMTNKKVLIYPRGSGEGEVIVPHDRVIRTGKTHDQWKGTAIPTGGGVSHNRVWSSYYQHTNCNTHHTQLMTTGKVCVAIGEVCNLLQILALHIACTLYTL